MELVKNIFTGGLGMGTGAISDTVVSLNESVLRKAYELTVVVF